MLEPPAAEDANGVLNPASRKQRLRAKVSRFWYADDVHKPTKAELEEAHAHGHGDGHGEVVGEQVPRDEVTGEEQERPELERRH